MKCPSCGAEVGENNIFCLSCGAKIESPLYSSASLPPLGGQTPPLVQPANPNAGPQRMSAPGQANRQYQAPQPPPSSFNQSRAANPRQFYGDGAGTVSFGNWLGTLLLLMFAPIIVGILVGVISSLVDLPPVVGTILGLLPALASLILMLVWAFGRNVNPSKRNFFRASLLLTLIMIVLVVVLVLVLGTLFASFFGELLGSSGLEGLNLDQLMQQFENLDLGNLPI